MDGLYTDLLLHDLGPALADPVTPSPKLKLVDNQLGRGMMIGGYSGGGPLFVEEIDDELPREWRTPPLWGIADSGPYMHDGRARTFAEAISLHDGEAAPTTKRFQALAQSDQAAVIAFLNSLIVPRNGEPMRIRTAPNMNRPHTDCNHANGHIPAVVKK